MWKTKRELRELERWTKVISICDFKEWLKSGSENDTFLGIFSFFVVVVVVIWGFLGMVIYFYREVRLYCMWMAIIRTFWTGRIITMAFKWFSLCNCCCLFFWRPFGTEKLLIFPLMEFSEVKIKIDFVF